MTVNSRNTQRTEEILRKEVGDVGPPVQDSNRLVPIPQDLYGDGGHEVSQTHSQTPGNGLDIEGISQLASLLSGLNQNGGPRGRGNPQRTSQIQGTAPASSSSPTETTTPGVGNRIWTGITEHRRLAALGGVVLTLAAAALVVPRYTGATAGDIVTQVAGGAKNAAGLGNTYGLILRDLSCAEPATVIDVFSQADLSLWANEALDPADVAKNKKDAKHPVVTKRVPLTPNKFSQTEFDPRPAKDIPKAELEERHPKIRFQDTLGVLACGGGYDIAGNTVTVDLQNFGIKFSSTTVLQGAGAKVTANPNMMNHYEGLYLQQNAKGKQYYTDKEIKSFNATMAKGDNPAILDAFRANILLPGINNECGLDVRKSAMNQITKELQADASEQGVSSLNVVFKDGTDFQNFSETFKEEKDLKGEIKPPSAVEFERPITTCTVLNEEQ